MSNYEAQSVIKAMEKLHPGVYTDKEQEIQDQLYDDGIYEGNWDSSTDFEDGTPNLRLIQEDEFDQHRTDDMPEWDDIVAEVSGGYLFLDAA